MKKTLFTLVLLFFILTTFAENVKRGDEVLIEKIKTENQQIKFDTQTLGNFTVEKVVSENKKNTLYKVKIFSEEGELVADYDVDASNKTKKNECDIVDASLKTMKDKVSHNSSNFINFHEEESNQTLKRESQIPQLNRVIKYLIEHKYL